MNVTAVESGLPAGKCEHQIGAKFSADVRRPKSAARASAWTHRSKECLVQQFVRSLCRLRGKKQHCLALPGANHWSWLLLVQSLIMVMFPLIFVCAWWCETTLFSRFISNIRRLGWLEQKGRLDGLRTSHDISHAGQRFLTMWLSAQHVVLVTSCLIFSDQLLCT